MAVDASSWYQRVLNLMGDSSDQQQRSFAADVVDTFGPTDVPDRDIHIQNGLLYEESEVDVSSIPKSGRYSWRFQPHSAMMPAPITVEVSALETDIAGVEQETPTVQPQTAQTWGTTTFVDCVLTVRATFRQESVEANSSVTVVQKDQ